MCMIDTSLHSEQILILANPKLRFKDDGETPKIWWGGDMARECEYLDLVANFSC